MYKLIDMILILYLKLCINTIVIYHNSYSEKYKNVKIIKSTYYTS